MKGIFLKCILDILKNYTNFIMIYHFYQKDEKLVVNLHDKTEHFIHMRNLKQALNHRLVLKKVHRVVKLHQKWLAKIIY